MRQVALSVAWHYLGKPYVWGGNDPDGFDCSGLVIEALKSVGRFPRGQDATAEGLRRRYKAIQEHERVPGDLVFWLTGDRATHVAMVIDPVQLYIGAEGGGSWATNPQLALMRDAFIKVRPVESRGTSATRRFADPYTAAMV